MIWLALSVSSLKLHSPFQKQKQKKSTPSGKKKVILCFGGLWSLDILFVSYSICEFYKSLLSRWIWIFIKLIHPLENIETFDFFYYYLWIF